MYFFVSIAEWEDDPHQRESWAPAQSHRDGHLSSGPHPQDPGAAAGQQAQPGRAVQAAAGPGQRQDTGRRTAG